jgi:RND family efflux transporter MFP subunit
MPRVGGARYTVTMKKRFIVGLCGIGILVVGGIYYATRPTPPVYETVTVERGTIENVVSVTGHIEPVDRVTLAFSRSGRIERIAVSEGAYVSEGTSLAFLDLGEASALVDEARARVLRERAMLTELTAPLRDEDRAVKEAEVTRSRQSVENSMGTMDTTLRRAFTYADDALHEEVDELFDGSVLGTQKFGIRFTYGSTDYFIRATREEETLLNDGRRYAEEALIRMEERIKAQSDVIDTLLQNEEDLKVIDNFLKDLAGVVNTYIPKDVSAQTVYEGFQTSVASARTALATALTEVRNAYTEHTSAVTMRELAEREYAQALSGASQESRAVQETSLMVAEQGVATALEATKTGVIVAPLTGRIARILPSPGEVVGSNAPVIELLTEGAYEVETYIPEADIVRVKIGDTAHMTFDALERTAVYEGEVVRIALVETVRDGVPTYKTTIVFTGGENDRDVLRPGMTADVDITTDVRERVLSIPSRSILSEDRRTYVRILTEEGVPVDRDITTGLRGSEGLTEVVSGLSEGEKVIMFVAEE